MFPFAVLKTLTPKSLSHWQDLSTQIWPPLHWQTSLSTKFKFHGSLHLFFKDTFNSVVLFSLHQISLEQHQSQLTSTLHPPAPASTQLKVAKEKHATIQTGLSYHHEPNKLIWTHSAAQQLHYSFQIHLLPTLLDHYFTTSPISSNSDISSPSALMSLLPSYVCLCPLPSFVPFPPCSCSH